MTINKYVLCTSFIWFFMFFSNSFIHSKKANADNPLRGFNIQIVKNMKTSEEMLDFLSIKIDRSKESMDFEWFDSEVIGEWLSITPEKVNDLSPQLLETTKRKIIIFIVCTEIMDEVVKKLQKLARELDQISPEMRSLLTNTKIALISTCTGDKDFMASWSLYK